MVPGLKDAGTIHVFSIVLHSSFQAFEVVEKCSFSKAKRLTSSCSGLSSQVVFVMFLKVKVK
jgi:hypothetical protein